MDTNPTKDWSAIMGAREKLLKPGVKWRMAHVTNNKEPILVEVKDTERNWVSYFPVGKPSASDVILRSEFLTCFVPVEGP